MAHIKTRSRPAQLRDWQAKKSLLRALYGVLGDKPLVAAVADQFFKETHADEMRGFVEKCYDALRHWGDGARPSGENSIQFWKWIIQDHHLEATVARMLSCSIVEFIELFPQKENLATAVFDLVRENDAFLGRDVKAELQQRYGGRADVPVAAASGDEYTLRGDSRVTFQGPLTGLQKGRIHIYQFYCVPETAKAWADLVDSQNYRMYMDCWLSLRTLVDSKYWKLAVGNGRYNAAATLGGGGSPEKDRVLATSLLSKLKSDGAKLEYVINDISSYMLHESAKRFRQGPIKGDLAERIEITYLLTDFLLLDEHFIRPSKWDCVVWAILGGTIGNVPERDFFRSINVPSKVGDLLVVGVDTIGGDTPDAFEERMRSQYRSKELDALLLTPFHAPIGRSGAEGPLVEVSVVASPSDNPYSSIPNSWTAVFSIPPQAGNDPVVLATSTRYVLNDFVHYAGKFGWEHLGTAPAPSKSTFRQVLLRRVK